VLLSVSTVAGVDVSSTIAGNSGSCVSTTTETDVFGVDSTVLIHSVDRSMVVSDGISQSSNAFSDTLLSSTGCSDEFIS